MIKIDLILFLNTINHYEIQKGIEKINQGIDLYPKRLDFFFGKAHILREIKDWTNFTAEVINAIKHAEKIKHDWL